MGHAGKILIVDDEVEALENCRRILSRLGHECLTEHDPVRALNVVQQERPGLVLTDLRMPGLSGIDVLNATKRFDPTIKVVLMTAFATVQTAVSSMRQGALDYILKPYTSRDLEDVAHRAFEESPRQSLSPVLARAKHPLRQIVGKSSAIQAVLSLVIKVARTDANILIYGESGTGKELVARAIHDHSQRANKPFVPVDCVSMPDALLESELFGHERGAFTGAHAAKPGLFETAHGGTVFLDEVSGMSQTLQSRLLRVLQERQFRRVGGTRYIDIDVRVIAASNRDLAEAQKKGEFREDLYYRLNVIPVVLPPLREREGDIEVLAHEFLQRFMQQHRTDAGAIPTFEPAAVAALMSHSWPGNVRELQNVIERAAALADGPVVRLEHLPSGLGLAASGDTASMEGGSYKQVKQEVVRSFERSFLLELLQRHQWHMSNAAQEAGVDRKTIERMVKRHGLREPS
ncbi:MAG: sigma-54 dependent transcriptional regulator [Nitrospirota bacterium]|nr:sigma-54 dependent transcriptional regulator [Nitrospirota bacterium]MDP2384247.1 sigma-54 dependent transcriptional regulator [Nitrospirota bacterium]